MMCSAAVALAACEREELPPVVDGGETGEGEVSPPVPEVVVNPVIDLSTEIISPEKGGVSYEFAEEVPALVLVRGEELKNVLYLPVTLRRSEKQPSLATVEKLEIPLDTHVKDLQIRVVAGGQWEAEKKQLRFGREQSLLPSAKRDALVIDQPYVSIWTSIAAQEEGEKLIKVLLPLTPRGTVVSHHVVSCEAPGPVLLDALMIDAASRSFSGCYDFSDGGALKQMEAQADFSWKVEQAEHQLPVKFSEPLELGNGEAIEGKDYLYVWTCPASGENSQEIEVTASGKVKDGEAFSALELYKADLTMEEGTLVEIGSRILIKAPVRPEGPLELTTADNRTSLVADGKDKVEFIVHQGGVDVTAECEINKKYNGIFDTPIKGHVFTSTTTGTFVFYATKDGKQSNSIQITAYQGEETDENGDLISGSKFCRNVTKQSGWFDVNKNWQQDQLLCWAAASSNMLQWWLEDLERKGYEIPASVPFGQGGGYSLRIFQEFVDCWTDYMNSSDFGISWFLKGGGMEWASGNGYSAPTKKGHVADGGYFKGVLPQDEEDAFFASEFVIPYGAWSNWEYDVKQGVHNDDATRWKRFSELILRLLDEGAVALSVDSHETTLWGCDVKDRLVTRVYITNSDDKITTLAGYDIRSSGGRIHLDKYPGKTNDPTGIIRLTGLKAYEKKTGR